MRVLSSRQVNPLIFPPDSLRKVLARVKEDMKRNPRLRLPEDNENNNNTNNTTNRSIFGNGFIQSLQPASFTS